MRRNGSTKILFILEEKNPTYQERKTQFYSRRKERIFILDEKKDDIFKKIQFFINIEFLFNSPSKIFKKIENLFILMFVNHLHQQTFKNLNLFKNSIYSRRKKILFILEEKIIPIRKEKSCLF